MTTAARWPDPDPIPVPTSAVPALLAVLTDLLDHALTADDDGDHRGGCPVVARIAGYVADLRGPEAVACPTCRAAPGDPCLTTTGNLADQPHAARRRQAQP